MGDLWKAGLRDIVIDRRQSFNLCANYSIGVKKR
jgi:hypothetical protein